MGPIGRKRGSLFGDKKDYVIEKKNYIVLEKEELNKIKLKTIHSLDIKEFIEYEELDPKYSLFLAVGFCGSFTTMSSFALESINLLDNKQFALFGLNVFGNVGLSITAVILGRTITLAVIRP